MKEKFVVKGEGGFQLVNISQPAHIIYRNIKGSGRFVHFVAKFLQNPVCLKKDNPGSTQGSQGYSQKENC